MAATKTSALFNKTVSVPLNKLKHDPKNVRIVGKGADIPELAASIQHDGLLQNLGIRPEIGEDGEPTGFQLVSVGSRRLEALNLLAKQKHISKTSEIPCSPVDDATSASLAENLHRKVMHPADAYTAFATMADEGHSDEAIAARHGCTVATVQRRLRLGRLSPVVMAALRENRISEAIAQAYAITTDHSVQERVFAKAPEWWQPHAIKGAITEGEVTSHDPRALLVGVDAYEAAGGIVRRDLFSECDDEGVTLVDVGLLDRLATERLAAQAEKLRAEGWADVRVSVGQPDDMRAYYPAPFEQAPRSDEDEARLEALVAEAGRLEEQGNEEGLTDDEERRFEEIQAEADAIHEKSNHYADTTKADGVAMVYLDRDGMKVFLGVPRTDTKRSVQQLAAGDNDKVDADPDDFEDGEIEVGKVEPSEAISSVLAQELLTHRTAALRAVIAQNNGLALRLLAQSLLLSQFDGARAMVAQIRSDGPFLRQSCAGIEKTPAWEALQRDLDNIGNRVPGEHADVLPWLLTLDDADVLSVLAPLVADTIDAGAADWSKGEGASLAAQVAQAAGLDMTKWWTPSTETYFGRVSKAQISTAVRESGEINFSADGRKADVAAAATRLVAGTGWLPRLLRMPPREQHAERDIEKGDAVSVGVGD
jgi:ParB family chromosome partitioning protein